MHQILHFTGFRKRILFILHFFIFFSFQNGIAQITLTVSGNPGGINGNYTRFSNAGGVFAALNSVGLAGRTIAIRVTANVTGENGANGLLGDTWASFVINPNGNRTVTGNVNGTMLLLDGADNIRIDGLNTGGNSLTFTNTSTGTNWPSVFTFLNDAQNNTITNCTILGSCPNLYGGVIYFGASAWGGSGNDDNTISNCNIGPAGTNRPTNGIYSYGSDFSLMEMNSGITISNNNVYNFFRPTLSSTGIFVDLGNHNWTITNNKIYQTATRTFTATNLYYTGIKIDPQDFWGDFVGYNFTVSGNIIGFADSTGTGFTTITGTGAGLNNKIRGIEFLGTSNTSASSVQGNTIAGITQTTNSNSTNSLQSCFIGIMLGSAGVGRFNVGTSTGNTIGSLTSSSITINQASTTDDTAPVIGIFDYTASSNTINNNNIAGITIQGTGTRTGFRGINVNTVTGATETISGNTIGGTNAAGAIINNQTGSYTSYCIQVSNANATITNNIIQNVQTNAQYPGYVILSGINLDGSTGTNTIRGNNIHSLSNNPGTTDCSIYAVDLTLPNTDNIVEKNKVHSIENTSNPAAQVVGLFARAGRATYQNNVVRLGINKSGTSVTLGSVIIGMWNASAVANNRFYHNSVYIGGTGVTPDAASFTACLYGSTTTANRYFQNNNLANVRQYSSTGIGQNTAVFYEGTATTGITSNYNNLYVTGADNFVGAFNGWIYYTLPAWTTGSTFDPISVSGNPNFVNPTGTAASFDLNIQTGSVCNNEGLRTTPLTPDDFNGLARDNSLPVATPDIGAYELARGTSPGTWIGIVDTDWNKTGNWDNGVVPTNAIDAYILRGHKTLGGNTDLPVIPTGSIAHSRNINLLHHTTSVIVTGTGRIRVAGSIFNRGIFDLKDGTLELNGTSGTQLIAGSLFDAHSIKNLVINNNVNLLSAITNDTLYLTESLSYLGNNRTFTCVSTTNPTYGELVLKSTSAATASVADLTNAGANNNNRISGDVNVERYIKNVSEWNLLAAPINNTQSAWNSWQNAGVAISGYGTRITGPNGPNTPQGIDNYSPGYSLKWWDEAASSWTGITNTTTAPVNRNRGYFLFVRGDRSVIPPSSGLPSTLRSKGPLYMGYSGSGSEPAPINYGSLAAGINASAANPFASAISFANVYANSNTTNIKQMYYLWDPTATGLYGVGRYQNFYYSGSSWLTTPTITDMASPYYGLSNYNEIQSGQAFFIESAGTGTVQVAFNENDKISGSRLVTREPPLPQELGMMSTMLHSNNLDVIDGNRVLYSQNFSNQLGNEDAGKITNSGINFSIASNAKQMIVEGRTNIVSTDTIHYNMSGISNGNYQLSFEPVGLQQTGLIAELIDAFLNTRTAISLSDSSWYAFETNSNPASKAANRFMLVFRAPGGPVPVHFISIAAQRQADRSVKVKWEVANEINIAHYEVERSADGRLFTGILQTDATNSGQYTKNDNSPFTADNYYRIKAMGHAGEITYSPIVKLAAQKLQPILEIVPNPVVNQQLNIRFSDMLPGNYRIQLHNALGQEYHQSTARITGSAQTIQINLPASTAAGNYQLSVINSKGEKIWSSNLLIE